MDLRLPDSYNYKFVKNEVKECIFRIKEISDQDQAFGWLNKFSFLSKTTWKKARTYPNSGRNNVFKTDMRCAHNTDRRATGVRSSKHTGCSATLQIVIKRPDSKKSSESENISESSLKRSSESKSISPPRVNKERSVSCPPQWSHSAEQNRSPKNNFSPSEAESPRQALPPINNSNKSLATMSKSPAESNLVSPAGKSPHRSKSQSPIRLKSPGERRSSSRRESSRESRSPTRSRSPARSRSPVRYESSKDGSPGKEHKKSPSCSHTPPRNKSSMHSCSPYRSRSLEHKQQLSPRSSGNRWTNSLRFNRSPSRGSQSPPQKRNRRSRSRSRSPLRRHSPSPRGRSPPRKLRPKPPRSEKVCTEKEDLDPDWPALITIRGSHNHELNTPEILKYRELSDSSLSKLKEYFQKGHNPASALESLKTELLFEYGEHYYQIESDGYYVPTYSKVQKLFEKEFSSVSGTLTNKVKTFQCSVCSATFKFNKNLYQHMRKKHNVQPPIVGKIICPFLCVETFRAHKDLRSHLETFHGQVIEKEELSFPDHEAFDAWKKRLEMTTGYAYTRRISEKTLRKGETKTHYICHRSGVFRSESAGIRQLKKVGSNKIGTVCPAVMEVTKQLLDGKVHVLFYKTHLGHEADVKRTPVKKTVRVKKSGSINYEVCAVLPAAGTGERMGSDTPKQYIPIFERPVICYTVEAFLRIPFIKKVVVVSSSENLDFMLQTLSGMCALQGDKLMVTEGFGSRHQSIDAGLKALQNCCEVQPEVVVIHDGVRPFVSEEIVCNVVLAAKEHGAAGVICPLVSTVISVDENGFLETSLDRSKYKASEMPQAFVFDYICKAYNDCSDFDLTNGTECLHLVQKYCDIKAKLLPGTTNLWKITHQKDIYTAKGCIKENQPVAIVNSHCVENFTPFLQTSLGKKFTSVQTGVKMNESILNKFPNLVHFWMGKSIRDVIELQAVFYDMRKPIEVLCAIHIILDCFEENLNFYEIQNQSRKIAKTIKSSKVVFYLILVQKFDSIEIFQELADLTTSLLFDCNPNLSGNIFFIS